MVDLTLQLRQQFYNKVQMSDMVYLKKTYSLLHVLFVMHHNICNGNVQFTPINIYLYFAYDSYIFTTISNVIKTF